MAAKKSTSHPHALPWVDVALRELTDTAVGGSPRVNVDAVAQLAHMSGAYADYLRAMTASKTAVAERRHNLLCHLAIHHATRELNEKYEKQQDALSTELQFLQSTTKSEKTWRAASAPLWAKGDKLSAALARAEKKLIEARGIPDPSSNNF